MDWWLFSIGLIAGILLTIAVDLASRWLYDNYRRPILDIPKFEMARIWTLEAHIDAYETEYFRPPDKGIPSKIPAIVYRLKIYNKGRSPANHIQGTLESGLGEHRLCWYEGTTANTIINAHDYCYLELYAVSHHKSNTLIIPTEHGWLSYRHDPTSMTYKDRPYIQWQLRVTAANCEPLLFTLGIDPEQQYRLVAIDKRPWKFLFF